MSKQILFGCSLATSLSTVFLLAAGALVTSTGSGLAVPDWPLSYGRLFPPMIGGILFEHGHRLVAGWILILTLTQALLFQFFETRPWVKKFAWALLGIVLLQALLGGITVLLQLPPQISIAHACLAQLFFCSCVFLTLVNSKVWERASPTTLFELEETFLSLPQLSLIVSVLFFVQLFFGATMRHFGAGLAIPDFPTAYGGIIPPNWNFEIFVHFTHRVGAFLLAFLVGRLCFRIQKHHASLLDLVALSGTVLGLLFVQILLGALVIWLKRPVPFTTLHLVTGALCFAFSISLHALIKKHEEPLVYSLFKPDGFPA